MIEYGSGNQTVAKPGTTCFYPRHVDDPESVLCDRNGMHPGRHAGWTHNGRRAYWTKEEV